MNMMDEIYKVFHHEIDTLIDLRDSLDGSYAEAVECLFQCQGKVIVSGVGKSGLIAQKIASTMTSTGTPATYLHPGDGMHGDVGIVQGGDVLLALSKSGESEELLNVLHYVKRIGVPVICITANAGSTLAKASALVLHTPVTKEACPLDLAPTSSTTAALVVGDALAMALLTMRGLTAEQFAQLHPGGQLGKRLLLTVADLMRSGEDNPVVHVNSSVRDMLFEISSKRCGAVSVVDDAGHLLGLVTDFDIRKQLGEAGDFFLVQIPEIMNPNPIFAYSDDKAIQAVDVMRNRERPFLVLPVMDRPSNNLVGMIHLHDLISEGL